VSYIGLIWWALIPRKLLTTGDVRGKPLKDCYVYATIHEIAIVTWLARRETCRLFGCGNHHTPDGAAVFDTT
jgi:hypothetical protein